MNSLAAAVLSSALALSLSACSEDPFVGTWVLNEAQTTKEPRAALEGSVFTIERSWWSDKYTGTGEGLQDDGTYFHAEFAYVLDGKEHTIDRLPDEREVVQSLERVDARTYKGTVKVAGKHVQTTLVAISADGNSMTHTMTYEDPRAKSLVAVYDKSSSPQDVRSSSCNTIAKLEARVIRGRDSLARLPFRRPEAEVEIKETIERAEAERAAAVAQAASQGVFCSESELLPAAPPNAR